MKNGRTLLKYILYAVVLAVLAEFMMTLDYHSLLGAHGNSNQQLTLSMKDAELVNCEIKDGKVTMIEATCPDHYCMKQKAVDEHGGSIICLPNKVVIEGKDSAEPSESDDSPKIDAVT